MTCETIARYGCASTAMCYVMHIGAVNAIMLRPRRCADRQVHPPAEQRQDRNAVVLRPGDRLALLVSGVLRRGEGQRRLQACARRRRGRRPAASRTSMSCRRRAPTSRATTTCRSSSIDGEHVAVPAIALGRARSARQPVGPARGAEHRGSRPSRSSDQSATALRRTTSRSIRGSSSAPRPCGTASQWARSTSRSGTRHGSATSTSACASRIIRRSRTTSGEAVMDTNASRLFVLSVAQAMDNATDNNTRMLEPGELARADFLHWAWQIKFEAAKNVAHHVDKMLHACGGSGYKRDMELERYLRDAKAGWVMGPTNEVLRQFVGKAVLLGFESLDYWNQTYNRRAVENELKKLDAAGKRELAEQLVAQADEQAAKEPAAATLSATRAATPRPRAAPARPGPGDLSRAARRDDRRRAAAGRPAHRARRPRRAARGARRWQGTTTARSAPRRPEELFGPASPAGAEETFRARARGCRRRDGACRRPRRRGRRSRLGSAAGGFAAPRPRERARAGAPGAARGAAARLRGRARLGARLRGAGRRVHPGDRRAGPPVLRLPRVPRGQAARRAGARAGRDDDAVADGERVSAARASSGSSTTRTRSRSSRSCATRSAGTTRSRSRATRSTTRTSGTSGTSTARTTSTASCCRTRSSRARAGRRSTSSSTRASTPTTCSSATSRGRVPATTCCCGR